MVFTHRYIARIVLEAETGLFVGSGEASLMKDALVQKDMHGLPMIQGTSLMGVIRHAFEVNESEKNTDSQEILRNALEDNESDKKTDWQEIFGFQKADKGLGSRLKISSAYMLINHNKIAEGITTEIPENVLIKYSNLPSRQHVRINDRGAAEKNGLFDNEIVYKGTRFIFELELKGTKEDEKNWQAILENFSSPLFRIGQGTRNGYGNLKIKSLHQRIYNLTKSADFEAYLNFDSSFNQVNEGFSIETPVENNSNLIKYELTLEPDSFFIFSEGFGDEEVDNKPVTEEIAIYKNDAIKFETQTLIPASSIKGALSHRTAFHYNKIEEQFIDEGNGTQGKNNDAVKTLFGYEAEGKEGQRGKVIINDFYYSDAEVNNDKIFNHVAIDRFTGGAMDGALFSEKVSILAKEKKFKINVYLDYDKDDNIKKAFENSIIDIALGLLPLGGMTTKGHGIFTGEITKNGETFKLIHHPKPLTETPA